MENKRNITISLAQARQWYTSGNNTLRELALSAYTIIELERDIIIMHNKIKNKCCIISRSIPVSYCEIFHAQTALSVIAEYFNQGWVKIDMNIGYYIQKISNEWTISKAYKSYPLGSVLFKNKEDAETALTMVKDSLDNM